MGSVSAVLLAALLLYLAFTYFTSTKSRRAAASDPYARMDARDVAERLGLAVVEGDPNLNLMMLHASRVTSESALRSRGGRVGSDTRGKRHGVSLRGTPNGRPQELEYWLETESESAKPGREGTRPRTLHFALTTVVHAPFPDFEVVRRVPSAALKPKRVFAWPAHPTGVPEVDSVLTVHASDERIAHLLGPLLAPLLDHTFVHVVGRGQRIELLADQMTSSYATYFVEDNAKLHHAIAESLEQCSESVAHAECSPYPLLEAQ